jgi:hypothetical protein
MEFLHISTGQEYVERYQLRWYGDVNRMGDKIILKKSVRSKRNRKEAKGTTKKTWKEWLQEVTRKKGVTWKEVERTVKDKVKWKALWNPLYTER